MALALPPKLEARLNRLSMSNGLFQRLLGFFFMPFISRSGLRVNYSPDNFYAYLPNKRFNLNWYGTMAGASILGNSELAAGSYLFMLTNGNYRMICKQLKFRFLLPSTDPVIFKAFIDHEELQKQLTKGGRFTIDMDIKLFRAVSKSETGKRIGSGTISFHAWPIGS
jgi:hypothetical protein